MNILGIDVGVHTGIALLDSEGHVMLTATIHVDDLATSLLSVLVEETDLAVCIEYPQHTVASSTATLRRATEIVYHLYPDASTVRPGVWKTSAAARQPAEVLSLKLSKHERDAIGIARWYRQRIKP